jgi:hypothetical protein
MGNNGVIDHSSENERSLRTFNLPAWRGSQSQPKIGETGELAGRGRRGQSEIERSGRPEERESGNKQDGNGSKLLA